VGRKGKNSLRLQKLSVVQLKGRQRGEGRGEKEQENGNFKKRKDKTRTPNNEWTIIWFSKGISVRIKRNAVS